MNLGELIKQKRIECGLKQKDVADHFGWGNGQYVSNFERGVSNPPLARAKELCRLLNIDEEKYKDLVFEQFESEIERAFE